MRDETKEQISVINWLNFKYPNALYTISPSGMKLPIVVAVQFKRMGYRHGTPDIMIFEPRGEYHGLFVEMKKEKGKLSEFQRKFIEELTKRHYMAIVCFGDREAIKQISEYMETR